MRAINLGRIGLLTALAAACVATAAAQTGTSNFVIGYSLQPLNNAVTLANGATITFPATQVGNTATGSLIIGNLGSAAGVVTSVVVTGSAFNTESLPLLPVGVGAGGELTVPLIYTPAAVGTDSGSLTIQAGGQTVTVNLAGTGIASQFQFQVTEGGQTTTVNPLGVVPVPDTALGATSTVSVTITNASSTTAAISNVSISGSGYQLTGVPPLPFNLLASASATVTFSFTPAQAGTSAGGLTIGSSVFTLAGRGLGPLFSYSSTNGSTTSSIVSGAALYFPQAAVGQSSTETFTISNIGTASGSIAGIYINPQNSQFSLGSLPAFPLMLAPGATASFQINFTPSATGGQQATLVIDGAQFTLNGSGSAGTSFQYSYSNGSTTAAIASGGTLFFPQAALGQSSTATFTIANTGSTTGAVAGIYISSQNSQFSLSGLPVFPLQIAPGGRAGFEVTFTPTATGGQQATLVIDGAQFTLSGSGSAPPPLPSYSLTGPSGALTTLEQVPITLSLSAPYSLTVSGTLTLTALPQGFSADPAIQFSTGGKTATFTIPANTTSAVFANGSNTIKLQTGSTAGTITLAPTFQTSAGASLTPAGGSALNLNVPAAVPAIIGAQVVTASGTAITISVTGVTDTQTLKSIDFVFTPASGYTLKTTTVSVPVSAAASAFFGSAAAQNFGGQFVATVPFNFTLGNTVSSAVSLIQSVSITATNDQGTSPAFTLAVQ